MKILYSVPGGLCPPFFYSHFINTLISIFTKNVYAYLTGFSAFFFPAARYQVPGILRR
jgi:hypothetical protein